MQRHIVMNKKDIIETVAGDLGVSKAEAGRVVDAVIDSVKNGIKSAGEVNIAGFGKFEVRERKAREGRNPKTGETIQIKASKSVGFKASSVFKSNL